MIDGIFGLLRAAFLPIPKNRAHLSGETEKRSSHHVQIGQSKLGGQYLAIYGKTPIVHLAKVELPFDDAEQEVDDRAQLGQSTVDVPLPFRQLAAPGLLERHAPDGTGLRITRQQVVLLLA